MGNQSTTTYSVSLGSGTIVQLNRPQPHLRRHYDALQHPRADEQAIVSLRSGLLHYAVQHGANFHDCVLGQDSFLGPMWLSMAKGYLGLLNGPTGRLDCGTLDSEIRRWAEQFGFSQEEAEGL